MTDVAAPELRVVDGHNDLPWAMRQVGYDFDATDIATAQPSLHTDLPRLRAGRGRGPVLVGVRAVLLRRAGGGRPPPASRSTPCTPWSSATPTTWCWSPRPTAWTRSLAGDGPIGSLLGAEGGHSIDNSLGVLRAFYRLGVRYLTLTHNENTDWADSATDEPRHGGLTAFGRAVVAEMNRLGMLVDLSHVAATTMHDALDATRGAGDLQPLLGPGRLRPPAQRARRRAQPGCRTTAASA